MKKLILTVLSLACIGITSGCSDKSPEPEDINAIERGSTPEKGTFGYGDGALGAETFNFIGEVLLKALN